MEEFVTVSVRVKPSSNESNTCLQVISTHPAVLFVLDKKSQPYHFDNIFTDDVSQDEVYNDTVKRLVDKVKVGYNCTVFAHGQTGTGKTYTIGINPHQRNEDEAGLIPRALKDFFHSDNEDNETEIEISFIEIYNEKVFDLLGPENRRPLPVKGFTAQGFQKSRVLDISEALSFLKNGTNKRHMGETRQNLNSSRSHAIFSIYCCSRNSERETVAKLNLVDLAGSESVRKTGNQGWSFYEGVNINKGLLSLGQVMTALSTNSSHIPYRQSIITTILQDSLNKKNFVSLIACVSPSLDDIGETLQTLEFSNRVKRMKNKPEVNEVILQYKKENPDLFTRGLTPLKRSMDSYETPFKRTRSILPQIPEPLSENNSNIDISPLFSSGIRSAVSETPANFSPVIRKYISAMENSMMKKLEDVIKTTLKRSTRTTRCDKENLRVTRLLWSGSKRDGTLDLSSENDSLIDSSSPLETPGNKSNDLEKKQEPPRTRSNNNSLLSEEANADNEDEFVFKVPKLKKQTKKHRSEAISEENTAMRRSARIQIKKHTEIKNFSPELENVGPRRSVRLQIRRGSNIMEAPKSFSPCLSCATKNRKAILKEDVKYSPITKRTKIVLDILNNGNIGELEKLHTVGLKTAERILLFRKMKGKLKTVTDIAEMPTWSNKKFEKFMGANFLMI